MFARRETEGDDDAGVGGVGGQGGQMALAKFLDCMRLALWAWGTTYGSTMICCKIWSLTDFTAQRSKRSTIYKFGYGHLATLTGVRGNLVPQLSNLLGAVCEPSPLIADSAVDPGKLYSNHSSGYSHIYAEISVSCKVAKWGHFSFFVSVFPLFSVFKSKGLTLDLWIPRYMISISKTLSHGFPKYV